MEGHCSTGQSPQWAVVPMEEEEEIKNRGHGQTLRKYFYIHNKLYIPKSVVQYMDAVW